MLDLPSLKGGVERTEKNLLTLSGDKVTDWELLLGSFYRECEFIAFNTLIFANCSRRQVILAMRYKEDELLGVLRLAHKYCMESIEREVLSILEKARTSTECFNLMLASRIVGSAELSSQALAGLKSCRPMITIEQARALGADTVYELYSSTTSCRFAGCTGRLHCQSCVRLQ